MKRILSALLLCTWTGILPAAETIRVGHFPNITHAQALIGLADGTFQKALGDTRIDVKTFTAGPSAVEALFAEAIDLAYVGPGPAINGFVKSHGEIVVISGACSGGASLVVRSDLPFKNPSDFHGKRIATPQLGGTQDIALRHWLHQHDLAPVEKGGDVQVLPMANSDQLTLFVQKHLDGAWAPEPWATRLVQEGKGRIYLDERDLWPKRQFATTVIVVRQKYLQQHPDIIKKWLTGHLKVTQWIKRHPDAARTLANREIKRITTKSLPDDTIAQAWKQLELTVDPMTESLRRNADTAYDLGFLGRSKPDITGLVNSELLNEVRFPTGGPGPR
jgi:NitT/TauT family transport system substrate-binding protein